MTRRTVFHGVGAAPGIGIGRVFLVDRRRVSFVKQRIGPRQVEKELQRFLDAVLASEGQLEELAARLRATIEERGRRPGALDVEPQTSSEPLSILDAHRLMLRDPMLIDGTTARIQREHLCAEWALRLTIRDIRSLLDELADNYFRERRSDIDFVGDRILRALSGDQDDLEREVPENAVVVAHELSPTDTLHLIRHHLVGFVTDAGARTSHTAILARALGLPAVVAAGNVADIAGQNDIIALDGSSGEVVLHPGRLVLSRYRSVARERARIDEELHRDLYLPTETACGEPVTLMANVELGEELESLLHHGVEGVGLLRTEFLFMRGELPGASAHRDAYIDVISHLAGRPLTIRTFDMGGDKVHGARPMPHEANPALGLRAIRYALSEHAMFMDQLRGILEASAHGPVRVLLPMISGVGELREALDLLEQTRMQLRSEGVPFDEKVPVGIMIEVPSAVWVADLLAREVDFFSVGTNDLVQYILAADRGNDQVAYLYRPLHTSVLRALRSVATAASQAGIGLAVCGEMASEPMYAPILIGLGFRELSMHALAVPRIKSVIRNLQVEICTQLVDELLRLPTVKDTEAVLEQRVLPLIPRALI
ncbi:MAG: phosphoenolpyruvate--protein phosphotransferase [Pseudomonadota bacterium]